MSYRFHTTCEDSYSVGESGEDIHEMTGSSHAVDIDTESFLKLADKLGFKEHVLDTMPHETEADLKNDWNIDCNKSYFQGLDCFYIKFSGIEHIFVKDSLCSQLLFGDEAELRREKIDELEEMLTEDENWNNAKELKEEVKILKQFVMDNISDFKENNILLASLFAYGGHKYSPAIKKLDNELLINPSKDSSFDYN